MASQTTRTPGAALSGPSVGQVALSLDTVSSDVVPDDVLDLVNAFTGPYAFGLSPVASPGGLDLEDLDLDLPSFLGSLFFLGKLAPSADADFHRL